MSDDYGSKSGDCAIIIPGNSISANDQALLLFLLFLHNSFFCLCSLYFWISLCPLMVASP